MVQLGSPVALAFALSIGAGLSTCIGGLIVFFKKLVHLASPKTLSISLSLSAGVMIFISLVEIFGKSVESYQKGFEKEAFVNDTSNCGASGFRLANKTENGTYYCSNCDNFCAGHSWLAASGTFVLGVLLIFGVDFIIGLISPEAHEEFDISQLNQLRSNTLPSNSNKGGKLCCMEGENSDEVLSETADKSVSDLRTKKSSFCILH